MSDRQPASKRLIREQNTVQKMIAMYCQAQHRHFDNQLCESCQELADYAAQRIAHCPFKNNKPTCANCPIHCYKPELRDRIREVMRYVGPRMLFQQPWLALMHLVDSLRKPPE